MRASGLSSSKGVPTIVQNGSILSAGSAGTSDRQDARHSGIALHDLENRCLIGHCRSSGFAYCGTENPKPSVFCKDLAQSGFLLG